MIWRWSELKRLLTKAQYDFSNEAYIMWPVVWDNFYPNPPKDPHVTVLYIGEISGANYRPEEVVDAMREATGGEPFMIYAGVDGLEMFGPENNIPVLRVSHKSLNDFRSNLEDALRRRGIFWDDKWPDYKPHVTVTNEFINSGVPYPAGFFLKVPELWWGNARYTLD